VKLEPVKQPLINNLTTSAGAIDAYDTHKAGSKMEGTLELGTPIINEVPADIEENYNSLVNKNSIIDFVGSPNNFAVDEDESQFRIFLRL